MRTGQISLSRLRKIIKEETATFLQGKSHPSDVTPDEGPWEDAEDVGRQDFISQMDKPTPAVKAERRLRTLRRESVNVSRRQRMLKQEIARQERYVHESARRRGQRS
jgi:hypothetical protein